MSRIAVMGEPECVAAFALAGVLVAAADGPDAVRERWRALPVDVRLVILTPAAHVAVAGELSGPDQPLWVVMPA